VTPNQDFIIDQHPHCRNLYVASGGSFHSWKFMPIIGKYVVQMLQGKLDSEKASRWAWDRPNNGGALPDYLPRRDLSEIQGYDETANTWGEERRVTYRGSPRRFSLPQNKQSELITQL
jgi:sarcosine oxidase/L-pipecolate oxidase